VSRSCVGISAALLPATLDRLELADVHWHCHSKEVAAASHQVPGFMLPLSPMLWGCGVLALG
jgi:hypothetical protein